MILALWPKKELAKEANVAAAPPSPADRVWGGCSGYFQDPDGHLWEIVWNPPLPIEDCNGTMRRREAIKKGHEKAVADQLLEVLGINATFVRNGDPNQREPDVIYTIDGRTIGIEVATAYYEDSDARDEWTVAAGEREFPPEGFEPRSGGVLNGPDQMICERVQAEVNDKCGKRYTGADEFWLCIEQRAALSDAASVRECVESLTVPPGHQFARLYVTYIAPLHESGAYTAVQFQ